MAKGYRHLDVQERALIETQLRVGYREATVFGFGWRGDWLRKAVLRLRAGLATANDTPRSTPASKSVFSIR
jgi:hypothetical protein